MFTVTDASAGGVFLNIGAGARGVLAGARLRAGGDAATATIRETDGNGRILAVLGAAAGQSDESRWEIGFTGQVHVTVSGSNPIVLLFQR